ncbi:MAG: bifunctional glutamate N-acetyltransferase/amino-acid acetyltransferase ArgJ [bacterium]|nr:bifunctional glutamate N-acetyltransferase/amino-acid acetyltransferase ArgJ [bacterium]MDD5755801.1 bifunctional glutamate N-acetyltransferase/amino-acid acetyltransferase ArgJ [bacterium]
MNHDQVKLPKGFILTGVVAGIARKKGKRDVGMIYTPQPCVAAAMFTTNQVKAAPVLLSQRHIAKGLVQAVVVNSGNANACTGKAGINTAWESAKMVAAGLQVKPEQVIVASTGVIGVPLPFAKLKNGILQAIEKIKLPSAIRHPLTDFSQSIMTTDTVPKIVSVNVNIGGTKAVITGVAKGSGMIHPNMATMLVFIMTDAAVEKDFLHKALKDSVEPTFNMLTVDGDTSTNDMVMVLASGQAGNKMVTGKSRESKIFSQKLLQVCRELTIMIARDGEGATKLVEVEVSGARDFAAAKQVAMSIAKSSLVKTAIFGNDPNWGRIIAAVGYSGENINPERVDITLVSGARKIQMCRNGIDPGFSEAQAKQLLHNKELKLLINLKQGSASATVYTCDFTHGYIDINASYRT